MIAFYLIQSSKSSEDSLAAQRLWEKQLESYKIQNEELSGSLESLKGKLEAKEKVIIDTNKLKQELRLKEEALRNETLSKEKFWNELKGVESQLINFRNKLEGKEKELRTQEELREGLLKEKEELKSNILDYEKTVAEFKSGVGRAPELEGQLNSCREVYEGLKEQYADLERQVDALNQALALEKTLHQRLKEECQGGEKSASL